ncbi:MAG: acyltransferase [Clostridiales bacterium]|nr:acyltransferase [Clostridiales bacterium]
MQDHQLRNKITWFSFALSLLVVWIHAGNAELFLGTGREAELLTRIESAISEYIGQIAVPGFFMISGYLFFRDFRKGSLAGKWERRIHSVLVPYILWNFLYYVGYAVASRVPGLGDIVGKGVIAVSLDEIVQAVLHYRYNPVFWYLYQLILLILVAPVLVLIFRRTWSKAAFFAVLLFLLAGEIALPFINTDALLYYSLAGAAASAPELRAACERPESGRLGILGGAVAIAAAVGMYQMGLRTAAPVGFVLCRLFAVSGLWFGVSAAKLPEAGEIARHNFFLYATHFAFVRLINKTIAMLLPDTLRTIVIPLILYLSMPFLVLGISTAGFLILEKCCPGLCRILNGNR